MKILGISTKSGKNYTVGQSPTHLDDGIIVENIIFHRPHKIYNGGFETSQPGYSVATADSPMRRLVPEHEVAEVWVDTTKIKNKKKDDEAPDMDNFLADPEE